MLRILALLLALGAATAGLSWLADIPGGVTLAWRGEVFQVSLVVALGFALAFAAVAAAALWGLGFVVKAPGRVAAAVRGRRRDKGLLALTRGIVAVGAGDAPAAHRFAREAQRHLADEPLTQLLRAQTAQLAGDRAAAVAAFKAMLESDETHLLGLRGLHVEARRAGDGAAALDYAERAYRRAAPAWAAQAVLDDYAARGEWTKALAAVEANAEARRIDRPTAKRWRAVLKTALAQERAERDAAAALALAREALELAPTLAPAAALAGRLMAAAGDLRRAARLLEAAYAAAPHPDLAETYLRLRPGDSAADRLARAKTLARLAPADPESALTLARANLEAQDPAGARAALSGLVSAPRATRRVCLLMAEIEDAADDAGAVREWLSRAARAPRDRAWVAEGLVADRWAPAGPNGALDAFVWRTPDERLGEPAPLVLKPARAATPAVEPAKPRPVAVVAPSALISNAPDDPGPQEVRNSARD